MEPSMYRITGIDHIHIDVDSPEQMADFLTKVGFTMVRSTTHGGGSFELRVPGSDTIIELTPTNNPKRPRPSGLRHIALRVDAIDEAYAELGANGIVFRDTPHDSDDTGRRVVNLTDPEGSMLQLSSPMA
jgi:catechol 2,3-dioxygenase-like lactoylglutathione lyase family enzyme